MDDRLRNEIRTAFEREQAAHPPAANLRHAVVRSVAARPARQPNLQWLAVAAAVMIGVLVVVSLVASRLHIGAPVNSHKPTVGEFGPPPASVHLLYLDQLDHDGTFAAYDWNGKQIGALNLGPQQAGLSMSADGQEFITGFGAKGGNYQFLDRLGQPLGATAPHPGAYGVIWADDSRSLCFMTQTQEGQGYAYTLWIERPGQAATAVGQIATDSALGQTVLNVVACSLANDTALVVRTTVAWPTELWAVRLSDGRAMAHHTYAAQALANIVASRDGKYIAETSSTANGAPYNPQNQPQATETVIRRVSDWAPVARMDAGYAVLEFSGDGGSVLVRTQITSHGEDYAIFRWGTDGSLRTVWQYLTPGMSLASYTSEPDGSSFALGFVALNSNNSATWCAPGLAGCTTPLAVTIVHGDGSTIDIPGGYNTAW